MTMFHQSQFPATPYLATSSVTASGVSTANVVATIDVPASHQGSDRPPTKNSVIDEPARRDIAIPIAVANRKYRAIIAQSRSVTELAFGWSDR